MPEVVAIVILLGGASVFITSLFYAKRVMDWRRENREDYILHERAMQAIRKESLLPEERDAILLEYRDRLTQRIERHYFGKKGRPNSGEVSLAEANRDLREENARLKSQLSSRR